VTNDRLISLPSSIILSTRSQTPSRLQAQIFYPRAARAQPPRTRVPSTILILQRTFFRSKRHHRSPAFSYVSKRNIGAIVGGSIGGVAFLALLAFLALFFKKRSRAIRKRRPISDPPPGRSQLMSQAMRVTPFLYNPAPGSPPLPGSSARMASSHSLSNTYEVAGLGAEAYSAPSPAPTYTSAPSSPPPFGVHASYSSIYAASAPGTVPGIGVGARPGWHADEKRPLSTFSSASSVSPQPAPRQVRPLPDISMLSPHPQAQAMSPPPPSFTIRGV
jgi:hypothetical protein